MVSNSEVERLYSLLLSTVIEDIGVNSWMVDRRRRSHLRRETMPNCFYNKMSKVNDTRYVFGSQTEGTTTPGMKSDTDVLYFSNTANVVLDWSKWQWGKRNLLVLMNEHTPPQHCYLQILRGDSPLPAVQPEDHNQVLDGAGRVLLTNTGVEKLDLLKKYSGDDVVKRHGPAITINEICDFVIAYHCEQLPEDCRFVFHRPRPGHWPRPDTLAKARKAGVFLVRQGYTESPAKELMCKSTALLVPSELTSYPYSNWQWRFSTSMMERYLMFDFSIVQVKTYTLAKIIRKTLFKLEFGDRLSTFHIKTAMMFTIENYPAEIWREDNIVKCVCLLLNTLKRWVKQKYCPHFTISGVNLFVGKLNLWELPKLCRIISNLIKTKLQCLFNTPMDNIGLRLQQWIGIENVSGQKVKTRTQICCDVLENLLYCEANGLDRCRQELLADHSYDSILSNLIILQSMSDSQSHSEREVASLLIPFVQGTLASILASKCILLRQPITNDILNRYRRSLDSDLITSRLKFASMLYITGHYDAAAKALTYCEGLQGPGVWQFCLHNDRFSWAASTGFRKKLISLSTLEVLKKHTMMCITFTKEELNCIPQQLLYEMHRGFNAEDRHCMKSWKVNVVTDCIPFLLYLQHLTYRELHKSCRKQTALRNRHRQRAKTALGNLQKYTIGTKHGHIDTAFNMLGHCYELQNRLDLAWMCYSKSLTIYPRENASIWHAILTLHKFLLTWMSYSTSLDFMARV